MRRELFYWINKGTRKKLESKDGGMERKNGVPERRLLKNETRLLKKPKVN